MAYLHVDKLTSVDMALMVKKKLKIVSSRTSLSTSTLQVGSVK